MYNILRTLRETTSSKEKLNILMNNKDNEDLKKVFDYAYNKISRTYGVTSRTIEEFEVDSGSEWDMFLLLNKLASRELSGNEALKQCKMALNFYDERDGQLFLNIIDRDLKVGVNEKTINKVWKGLIPKPYYCRCNTLNEKTLSKIKFPCYVQLKCDGTYRQCYVNNGVVEFKTRSGEVYSNPILEDIMKDYPNGYYLGEFTVGLADDPLMNRQEGNGNINSDNPNFENIHFTVWDYLTDGEYSLIEKTKYEDRYYALMRILMENRHKSKGLVHLVPTYDVSNINGAFAIVTEWMNKGLEGGVLKSKDMLFKNGTSNEQLKIKLKVDVEMRCVGFLKGTKGTKYEDQNKVILFENDDKTIKGQCSGMTDSMVLEVTKNPSKYIGKVLTVQFNDIVKAEDHEYYALSHPRFIEFRTDKNLTDNISKVRDLITMAKILK